MPRPLLLDMLEQQATYHPERSLLVAFGTGFSLILTAWLLARGNKSTLGTPTPSV